MGLSFYPSRGTILVCRYDTVVIDPEMRKARPAVVIGPRLRSRGRLVTVVPLSTTAPAELMDFHCKIELVAPLPPPFNSPVMWAKCDLISSVSLDRLDRFKEQHQRGGPRRWRTGSVNPEQLRALKVAVLCGLGFNTLTKYL
jgi:mRNA interferase MazF